MALSSPRIPPDTFQLVLDHFMDARLNDPSLSIIPLLQTSKSISRIVLPRLYKNIHLHSNSGILSFLWYAQPKYLRYIKTIRAEAPYGSWHAGSIHDGIGLLVKRTADLAAQQGLSQMELLPVKAQMEIGNMSVFVYSMGAKLNVHLYTTFLEAYQRDSNTEGLVTHQAEQLSQAAIRRAAAGLPKVDIITRMTDHASLVSFGRFIPCISPTGAWNNIYHLTASALPRHFSPALYRPLTMQSARDSAVFSAWLYDPRSPRRRGAIPPTLFDKVANLLREDPSCMFYISHATPHAFCGKEKSHPRLKFVGVCEGVCIVEKKESERCISECLDINEQTTVQEVNEIVSQLITQFYFPTIAQQPLPPWIEAPEISSSDDESEYHHGGSDGENALPPSGLQALAEYGVIHASNHGGGGGAVGGMAGGVDLAGGDGVGDQGGDNIGVLDGVGEEAPVTQDEEEEDLDGVGNGNQNWAEDGIAGLEQVVEEDLDRSHIRGCTIA